MDGLHKYKMGLKKIRVQCGGISWEGFARNEHTAFRQAIRDASPHERMFAPLARFSINGGEWFYQEPQSLAEGQIKH